MPAPQLSGIGSCCDPLGARRACSLLRALGSPMAAPVLLLLLNAMAAAQSTASDRPPSEVVATVGSEPIYAAELARLLDKALSGQKLDGDRLRVARERVLSEVVSRRLVLAYARRTQTAPSEAEIDAEIAALTKRLDAAGSSLEKFLAEQSLDRKGLRRQAAWNILWPRYLERYITEERAKAHFDAHCNEFDGTELSVRHILLRPDGSGSEVSGDAVRNAREIRQAIVAGKMSFEEAARKHSISPSAEDGGMLGWIGRRGPMVESFTEAAFSLKEGEISGPVRTPFGVHLIRCERVRPGTRQLGEVREAVNDSLARELLEKLAASERKVTPVAYPR